MTKVKIPKGWRELIKGEIIRTGDKFYFYTHWIKSSNVGLPVSFLIDGQRTYIRRIARKAK